MLGLVRFLRGAAQGTRCKGPKCRWSRSRRSTRIPRPWRTMSGSVGRVTPLATGRPGRGHLAHPPAETMKGQGRHPHDIAQVLDAFRLPQEDGGVEGWGRQETKPLFHAGLAVARAEERPRHGAQPGASSRGPTGSDAPAQSASPRHRGVPRGPTRGTRGAVGAGSSRRGWPRCARVSLTVTGSTVVQPGHQRGAPRSNVFTFRPSRREER